jgi:hypothetical protein
MVEWLFLLLTLGSATILQTASNPVDPIQVSILNQDEVADYYFNMYTTVMLEKSSYIYIVFPGEYETVTTSGVKQVANRGLGNELLTTCVFTQVSSLVTATLAAQVAANSTFSMKLEGVKNPGTLTSTGNFQIYTRKANDIANTTTNLVFGTLAFTPRFAGNVPGSAVIDLAVVSGGFVDTVASKGTYYFRITIDRDVSIETWFKLQLPTGWTKDDGIDGGCGIVAYLTT